MKKMNKILIIIMVFTVMGIFMACSLETLEVDSFTSGEATFIYGSSNSISKIWDFFSVCIVQISNGMWRKTDTPIC